MAADPTDALVYFLRIEKPHADDLGSIRQWNNLKIAQENDYLWVKEFTQAQIDSLEVKSIPYKRLYYAKQNKLFPQGSQLPGGHVPALLWTSIERGLPVELPSCNHNFFGISEQIPIRLNPSADEQAALGLVTTTELLEAYLKTASAIRLQKIQWIVLNQTQALLLGTPVLPMPGETLWCRKDHLLPVGYDFEFPILADALHETLNPSGNHWLVWTIGNTYFTVSKKIFQPLSLSSFRLTAQTLLSNPETTPPRLLDYDPQQ